MTDRDQLHHLADRARRGVLLPAEGALLADEVTAMAERLDRANKAIRFMLQQDADAAGAAVRAIQLMNEAGTSRDKAEAAIERVRAVLGPYVVDGGMLRAADVRAALDQPQQPTTTEVTA